MAAKKEPKAEQDGLFDFLNAINFSKNDLIRGSEQPLQAEKSYNAYMVNRGLSYFIDTVLYANEMNMHPHLDSIAVHDYLLNSVRKGKRFSKWFKSTENSNVSIISAFYNVSISTAKEYAKVLTSEQISSLREQLQKGGV